MKQRAAGLLLVLLVLVLAVSAIVADPPPTPPILPTIDGAMKVRLRGTFVLGRQFGNRNAVFAKLGDSITESDSFLKDIGCSEEVLGDHRPLEPTMQFFRAVNLPREYTDVWCEKSNSFSRASAAATSGWSADDVLRVLDPPVAGCPPPYATALKCELHLLRPSVALIMFGTNDLARHNRPELFQRNLNTIVSGCTRFGVIPVLSTIPPRLDSAQMGARVAAYNAVVMDVARSQQVPLWNYWLALQSEGMINQGMSEDGIHPSIPPGSSSGAADFTAGGLRYGYNRRNLTAVQVLQKIRRVVFANGRPDRAPEPDFALSASPLVIKLTKGSSTTGTIRIARVGGHTAPVQLRLRSAPSGLSATFHPDSVTGATASFTLTASTSVATGEFVIMFSGTSGNLTRTVSIVVGCG